MVGKEFEVSSSERGYFLPLDDDSFRALNHLLMHGVPENSDTVSAAIEAEGPAGEDVPVTSGSDLIDGYSGSSLARIDLTKLELAILDSEYEHDQENERNRDAERGFLSIESGDVARDDVSKIFSDAVNGITSISATPSMFGTPVNATVDFGPKRRFRRNQVHNSGRFALWRRS